VLGGGPVELGTGNCDFRRFFRALEKLSYSGHFIMQAFRDDEGVAITERQLSFVKPFICVLAD
jgi:sugar phosphate isomerase/epimerase